MTVLCLDFEPKSCITENLIDKEIYKYVDVQRIEWHCPLEFKQLTEDKGRPLVKMEIDIDEWDILHINSLTVTFKANPI